MLTSLSKAKYHINGVRGLPEHYPVPPQNEHTLFYIQRNLNHNTVVYEMNTLRDGLISDETPMKVYWIKYTQGGKHLGLNVIQNKLAYGYESEKIAKGLYSFRMVSYKKIKFYIAEDKEGKYRVITSINGEQSYLSNIYVYAEELGLFPDVKYFEMYGENIKSGLPNYEKINL